MTRIVSLSSQRPKNRKVTTERELFLSAITKSISQVLLPHVAFSLAQTRMQPQNKQPFCAVFIFLSDGVWNAGSNHEWVTLFLCFVFFFFFLFFYSGTDWTFKGKDKVGGKKKLRKTEIKECCMQRTKRWQTDERKERRMFVIFFCTNLNLHAAECTG